MRLLAFLLTLLCFGAQAANVTWTFPNAAGKPQTNCALNVFPLQNPRTNGSGGIVTRDRLRSYTDSTGSATITNLFFGYYRSEFEGFYNKTTNFYYFPDTTAAINAADYVTNISSLTFGTVSALAYSQAQSDLRFIARASGTGNNVTLTNLNIGASGVTNGILYATNLSFVVSSDNTNSIYVTTAGTASANGTYGFMRALDPPRAWLYTNGSPGNYLARGDPNTDDDEYMIRASTNDFTDGSSLYTGTSIPGQFPANTGNPPSAQVRFGTNYMTNVFSVVYPSGAPLLGPVVSRDLYLDATNGNDMFWLRGRPDRAMQTFTNAAAMMAAGDILHIAPGDYIFPASVTLPDGISLLGSGRSVTRIGSAGGGAKLNLRGTNPTVKDLFIGGMIYVGSETAGGAPVTNCILENVDVAGSQDGIFLSTWETAILINSTFRSPWDAYADYQQQTRAAYSNALVVIRDCHFLKDDTLPGIQGPEAFVMGTAQVKMYGGSIQNIATNAVPPPSYPILNAQNSGGEYGRMDLYGVSLETRTLFGETNIYNPRGGIIKLHDMLVSPSQVYDPSNRVMWMTRDGSTITNVGLATISMVATNLTSGGITNASVDLRGGPLKFLRDTIAAPNIAVRIQQAPSGDRIRAENLVTANWLDFNIGLDLGMNTATNTPVISLNPSSGLVTATTFSGSGASLTALTASQLTTGTIPNGRYGIESNIVYSVSAANPSAIGSSNLWEAWGTNIAIPAIELINTNGSGLRFGGLNIIEGYNAAGVSQFNVSRAGVLTASGAGLTAASVPDSALSANVPLLNAAASQTFFGVISNAVGFASPGTNVVVVINPTGVTNTYNVDAVAMINVTNVAYVLKTYPGNAASSPVYTSSIMTGCLAVPLHPGWAITNASGLSGRLVP